MVDLLSKNKKSLKQNAWDEHNTTRGTTQIAAIAAASHSDKCYPLTRADGRHLLKTVQRSGSEVIGTLEWKLPAFTNRRLSENDLFRPSSSTPFEILGTL